MSSKQLFEFENDNKNVKVFTGGGGKSVYFKNGDSSSTTAKMEYNKDTGTFKATDGSSLTFAEAEARVRSLIK